MQTHIEIRDYIEMLFQDSGNAVWITAELDLLIADGLREIARYAPTINATALMQEAQEEHREEQVRKKELRNLPLGELRKAVEVLG